MLHRILKCLAIRRVRMTNSGMIKLAKHEVRLSRLTYFQTIAPITNRVPYRWVRFYYVTRDGLAL